ncbi:hypothetical protein C8Q74DRAFT_1286689 [Fomes fomentarius]|nr:hypothetical protein C8Q74DRAFT_1286689 [Fomes fomentarius]
MCLTHLTCITNGAFIFFCCVCGTELTPLFLRIYVSRSSSMHETGASWGQLTYKAERAKSHNEHSQHLNKVKVCACVPADDIRSWR